ncbi:hypothetical protein AAF712_003263 [Marasmius tenuissimus]|uniref:Uncharacterized protein n=1 Tax=Marasmius tenuissimus TaxID=585030 RepID=A0ABR3A7V9_9AGAR|nr:hypothetical protein PM082_012073 [Marasmius tenuissimus]
MKHHKLLLHGAEDENEGYTPVPGPGGWNLTRPNSSTHQDTQKREEGELEEHLREVE